MNASDITRAAAGQAAFSGYRVASGCIPFCGSGAGASTGASTGTATIPAAPLGIRSDASGCQLAYPCGYASASEVSTGAAACGYIPTMQYTSTTAPKVCPQISYVVPLKR